MKEKLTLDVSFEEAHGDEAPQAPQEPPKRPKAKKKVREPLPEPEPEPEPEGEEDADDEETVRPNYQIGSLLPMLPKEPLTWRTG